MVFEMALVHAILVGIILSVIMIKVERRIYKILR